MGVTKVFLSRHKLLLSSYLVAPFQIDQQEEPSRAALAVEEKLVVDQGEHQAELRVEIIVLRHPVRAPQVEVVSEVDGGILRPAAHLSNVVTMPVVEAEQKWVA